MTTSRPYRLAASTTALRRRLAEVVRQSNLDRVAARERVHLRQDGDRFALLLARGDDDDDDLAARVDGSTLVDGDHLRVEVEGGRLGLRPGAWRRRARALGVHALAIAALYGLAAAAGLVVLTAVVDALARVAMITLVLGLIALARRVARRRRDRAELLSLIEAAAGPLAALPDGDPMRAPGRPPGAGR